MQSDASWVNCKQVDGSDVWRATKCHHRTPTENGGKHNVFVTCIEDGQIVRDGKLEITWGWAEMRNDQWPAPKVCDKQTDPYSTDIPIEKDMHIWCAVLGDVPSDVVSNLHAVLPSDGNGNDWHHHSYDLTFERQRMTTTTPLPVTLPTLPFFDSLTDVELLARLIYGEARGEDNIGRAAVGQVALNRAARPGWWGTTLREVILRPYQFSCFNEDYRASIITPREDSWLGCVNMAYRLLAEDLVDATFGATNYYADYIAPPDWAAGMTQTAHLGRHVFLK